MKRFTELRNKYERLFYRLLDDYKFYFSYLNEYHFVDDNSNEMKLVINDENILVIKKDNNINTMEMIKLPDENNNRIECIETIDEKLESGIKVDEVIRFYKTTENDNKYYLTDLYQKTTCANEDFKSITNFFESHMRKDKNVSFSNIKDVSDVYKDVEGPLKVEKIFDLYNGNITKLLDEELLDSPGFDLKRKNGIKTTEEEFLEKNKEYAKI